MKLLLSNLSNLAVVVYSCLRVNQRCLKRGLFLVPIKDKLCFSLSNSAVIRSLSTQKVEPAPKLIQFLLLKTLNKLFNLTPSKNFILLRRVVKLFTPFKNNYKRFIINLFQYNIKIRELKLLAWLKKVAEHINT